jgi:hypothetical protein
MTNKGDPSYPGNDPKLDGVELNGSKGATIDDLAKLVVERAQCHGCKRWMDPSGFK